MAPEAFHHLMTHMAVGLVRDALVEGWLGGQEEWLQRALPSIVSRWEPAELDRYAARWSFAVPLSTPRP